MIIFFSVLMYGPIQFNNDTGSMAIEVGNKAIQNLLTTEMKTAKAVIAYVLP